MKEQSVNKSGALFEIVKNVNSSLKYTVEISHNKNIIITKKKLTLCRLEQVGARRTFRKKNACTTKKKKKKPKQSKKNSSRFALTYARFGCNEERTANNQNVTQHVDEQEDDQSTRRLVVAKTSKLTKTCQRQPPKEQQQQQQQQQQKRNENENVK